MSSNSVCIYTRDETNRTPATRSSDFVNHSYEYRLNWTPLSPITIVNHLANPNIKLKDGAYYCYCAYILRIARYSGFLWVVPTNTGKFLRGLKLYGESRT